MRPVGPCPRMGLKVRFAVGGRADRQRCGVVPGIDLAAHAYLPKGRNEGPRRRAASMLPGSRKTSARTFSTRCTHRSSTRRARARPDHSLPAVPPPRTAAEAAPCATGGPMHAASTVHRRPRGSATTLAAAMPSAPGSHARAAPPSARAVVPTACARPTPKSAGGNSSATSSTGWRSTSSRRPLAPPLACAMPGPGAGLRCHAHAVPGGIRHAETRAVL